MPQQHQEIQPHEMHTEEQNQDIQQHQMQIEEQEPEVMEGTNGQPYPSQPMCNVLRPNVLKKSKQIRFKLKGDSSWQTTTPVRCSGKSTGNILWLGLPS